MVLARSLLCSDDVASERAVYAQAAAAIAAKALAATGWEPVDSTLRYWRHWLRYGPAIFDTFEVEAIERRDRPEKAKPQRARRCACSLPFGRIEEFLFWKCGKHVY